MSADQFLSFEITAPLFAKPKHLTQTTAWHGHLPFARWIVAAAKPGVLVELGVHEGASYCTFCESVERFGTNTKCYGVDAWEGDHQAGFYGDQVLKALSAYHDPLYSSFSTLVQKWFADAAQDFEDGSIDLLHIDGLHTYDAVKADFEAYLPKMSKSGVILFHDTVVRHGDFGVWALWEELTKKYPHFEFTHSNGLGVLCVGETPPPALAWLCGLKDPLRGEVHDFFANIGNRLIWETEESRIRDRLTVMETSVNDQQTKMRWENEFFNSLVQSRMDQVKALQEENRRLFGDYKVLEAKAAEIYVELDRAKQIEAQLAAVLGSTSWRITKPLRDVKSRDWAGLKASVKPVAKYGWGIARKVLPLVPGGKKLVDRVTASRIAKFEQLERERLKNEHKPRYFAGQDLTTADMSQVTPLVTQALKGAPVTTQAIAPIITEIAAQSGHATKDLFRRFQQDVLDKFLARDEEIRLPHAFSPKVSIILVLYNNAELTLPCLKSLQSERDITLEVIIIDNASSDRTHELLEKVKGAKIVKNEDNIGFLLAVNQAAEMANGEHILLFNNDATMRPGTLEAAIKRLDSDPGIGAVGGRIMLLDGRLQEAGSIVWNDGTCLGYARGDEEDAPHVMFARDVDYCSGAFLLTPKKVWEELGGFDTIYAPAYYEETDYCMRLWEKGYRVVYDPKAIIDHFEFGSAAKSDWAIAQQQKNHLVFKERHKDYLAAQYTPSEDNISKARIRGRKDALSVLMVDDRVPYRHMGAGYPRAADIAETIVAMGHKLTYYPLQFPFDAWDSIYSSLNDTVEIARGFGVNGFEEYLVQNAARYDVLIISRPHNMAMFKRIFDKHPDVFTGVRIVYDAEAVFANRDISKAEMLGKPMSSDRAAALVSEEISLTAPASIIATVSGEEANSFRGGVQAPVEILGHKLEAKPSDVPFSERRNLLFVGALVADDTPNVDSLVWFSNEVLPKVNLSLEQPLTLQVVGKVESGTVQTLASEHIHLMGRVENLDEIYDQSRIFIAPTRYAAGIPHKVHEAAAHGLPCVATELIARQLGWAHDEAILVGKDATEFAAQIVRLYQDEELWTKIRGGSLKKLSEDCAPDQFVATIARLLTA
ncbi:class I SAM-dependent methyltransferase [Roseibium sp.]|uniref:class I SAM-dependent methyltransferase n=1 Tax=Roseibium sp. TaxID=1936156 RepID=UPI003BAA9D62